MLSHDLTTAQQLSSLNTPSSRKVPKISLTTSLSSSNRKASYSCCHETKMVIFFYTTSLLPLQIPTPSRKLSPVVQDIRPCHAHMNSWKVKNTCSWDATMEIILNKVYKSHSYRRQENTPSMVINTETCHFQLCTSAGQTDDTQTSKEQSLMLSSYTALES